MTQVNGAVLGGLEPPDVLSRRRDEALDDLRDSLRELLRTLLKQTVGVSLERAEELAGAIFGKAGTARVGLTGVLGALRAGAAGRNPVWGALTAAVDAMSPGARVALVVALVLAVVLLPVTVVLVLLALIVAIVVAVAAR